MDLVVRPVRMAVSKPALQAYISLLLFVTASTVLYALASVGYIAFYQAYIPQISIQRVVHLQFGQSLNPHAFIPLAPNTLVPSQAYDLVISLDLPRSPPNLAAGNFMIDLAFLDPSFTSPDPQTTHRQHLTELITHSRSPLHHLIPHDKILFSTARPAILTYQPHLVSLGKELTSLPWYLLGWRRDAETLDVKMAESVSFTGSKKVPGSVYVELRPSQGEEIQVYDAVLKLHARFSGLRWVMYNYRILSFVVFATGFWVAEVLFMGVAWVAWGAAMGGRSEASRGKVIKREDRDARTMVKGEGDRDEEDGEGLTDEPDLSATERTFPTYGRQLPLRYLPPRVKKEDGEEHIPEDDKAQMMQPFAADEVADDESEEPVDVGRNFAGGRSDSGIGTSFSEGGGFGEEGTSGLGRRRSRGGRS